MLLTGGGGATTALHSLQANNPKQMMRCASFCSCLCWLDKRKSRKEKFAVHLPGQSFKFACPLKPSLVAAAICHLGGGMALAICHLPHTPYAVVIERTHTNNTVLPVWHVVRFIFSSPTNHLHLIHIHIVFCHTLFFCCGYPLLVVSLASCAVCWCSTCGKHGIRWLLMLHVQHTFISMYVYTFMTCSWVC